MALTQRLGIRQSQALVMTPQLSQAIKLLQRSNLHLAPYEETELEKNPLLERSVEEKLGRRVAEVEVVLAVLQGFEPLGVCARNLTECLAIQLKELDRFDPAMQRLVAHLDLLAKRDLAALRKVCDVSEDDLSDMIAEIRHLNPKPGLAFGNTLVQPIVPDVVARQGPDGRYIVELNSDTLPKVLLNQSYYAEVAGTARNDKDKTYLADCLQTATWLVRGLEQPA